MMTLSINRKPFVMQLDMAVDVLTMPQDVASNIPDLCVEPCYKMAKDYSNNSSEVVGFAKVNVEYCEQSVKDLPITIVKGPG